jgi:hypothetical protein
MSASFACARACFANIACHSGKTRINRCIREGRKANQAYQRKGNEKAQADAAYGRLGIERLHNPGMEEECHGASSTRFPV